MIMIYNNEKKEYKIKIWASKLEKLDIKNEYNKIIKIICEKKIGNNILKNLFKLNPDKYTILFSSKCNFVRKRIIFYIYYNFYTK